MPVVSPAPLSACTLAVFNVAYPHPLASTCCCQGGPLGASPPRAGSVVAPGRVVGPRAVPRAPRAPAKAPNPPAPNCIITGTGPVALAGVDSETAMFTLICGYDELSTWPTSCLVIIGTPPLAPRVVLVTSQVTLGVSLGVRPYTSRSKSSRISGRRLSHHVCASVTFCPFFNSNGSGRFG